MGSEFFLVKGVGHTSVTSLSLTYFSVFSKRSATSLPGYLIISGSWLPSRAGTDPDLTDFNLCSETDYDNPYMTSFLPF